MSETLELPDEVYREVNGRILGRLPAVQRAFRSRTTWDGPEFEKLLVSIWILGFEGALADLKEMGGEIPGGDLAIVMDWLVLRKET